MKNLKILGICLVLIISIRFALSDSAFREQFYIDYLLKENSLLKGFNLDNEFTFTVNPKMTTEEYQSLKAEQEFKKNTFIYSVFISYTILRVLSLSFLIYYIGLILGFLIYRYVKDYKFLESVFGGFRSIPALAWIPLLSVIGLLFGVTGVFVFIFLGTFPLVMSQIILGIKSCPEEIKNTLALYKLDAFKAYWSVVRKKQERIFMHALSYGMSHALVLSLVYEVLFEKTPGVMRIIQPLSVGYDLGDAVLLVLLVMLIGISFDRIPKIILDYRFHTRMRRAQKIAERVMVKSV